MISFALEEDQELLQATVRKFASDEIRPAMRAWERARDVPDAIRRKVHELGLGLIDAPEALGGGGASLLTAMLAHEELAFGDPGAAVALVAPHLCSAAILALGSAEQATRLLARFAGGPEAALRVGAVAWSEVAGPEVPLPREGFSTVATRTPGGYLLQGSKAFVVNAGRADLTVVFAQLDAGAGWDGAGAFVLEGPAAGMSVGERYTTLGLETVWAAPLDLRGVFVPEDNRLAGEGRFSDGARRFFERAALINAARQVGLARASYEYALAYTQERQAFGKPVAHFQSIAFTLAEMHMDVESARWMLWRAAWSVDRAGANEGDGSTRAVLEAAQHANDVAWRVADGGVQLLGGAGYIQDFPVEKWLRDTKALALFSPPDQLLSLGTGAALGLTPDDAQDALPSSVLQAIFT